MISLTIYVYGPRLKRKLKHPYVVFWDMIVAFFQQGQNGWGKTDVVC